MTGNIERLAPYRTASALGTGRRLVKRAIDLVLGAFLVLLLLPLLAAVALAVRWTTPGPVLFRQERVGYLGRPFTMFKFRSMRIDGEDGAHREYVRRLLEEDRPPAAGSFGGFKPDLSHRVTRVGRLLRRTSIDELPQLFNVLRGDMNFIGPRPERPFFAEQLALVIPRYDERTRILPGITGWAQINYPYGASVEDAQAKLAYDLSYVRNRSLWLDLLILFATVRVVMFGIGAR